MTWSYNPSLATDKDKVRFMTGLTDENNQRVSDEEIAGILAMANDNVYEAAAMVADSLAGQYSSSQSLKIDGFSIDYSERATHFRDLAKRIRIAKLTAPGALGAPFVGGVSISEMESVREDTDRVPSRFRMGMHDAPGTDPVDLVEYEEQQ